MTTASGEHLEVIHHPGYDTAISMPFVPAIKVKSGKLLWLSGGTALPVYHDHPHQRDQIVKHLPNDLEAQVQQTMDGIMATLRAAGGSPRDVVHLFIFRARPRIGDIGGQAPWSTRISRRSTISPRPPIWRCWSWASPNSSSRFRPWRWWTDA
jgi:enamine deaminase RidA (YjgF/YER057c/UK114 family)